MSETKVVKFWSECWVVGEMVRIVKKMRTIHFLRWLNEVNRARNIPVCTEHHWQISPLDAECRGQVRGIADDSSLMPIIDSFCAWKPSLCHKDTEKGKKCQPMALVALSCVFCVSNSDYWHSMFTPNKHLAVFSHTEEISSSGWLTLSGSQWASNSNKLTEQEREELEPITFWTFIISNLPFVHLKYK